MICSPDGSHCSKPSAPSAVSDFPAPKPCLSCSGAVLWLGVVAAECHIKPGFYSLWISPELLFHTRSEG